MHFHDTRAEYDAIAKWLEENDTEVDWEAVMKSDWWVGPADWVPPPKWSLPKPFPSPIPPQTVSNLILSQVNKGFRIPWPLGEGENESNAPGGEGVQRIAAAGAATGPSPWEKFLYALERQEHLTIRLITPEERKALVRMAWIEEELRKREVERNRWRVRRQNKGEAEPKLKRRSVKRLRAAAGRGNREAIWELERRGKASEEELGRWKEVMAKKAERCREMRKKRKVKSLFWPEGAEMKKKKEEEVEEVSSDGPVGEPGEVELEVMRVGPNPRMLTCRYFDDRGEVKVGVRVKSIRTFKRGMKFRMVDSGVEGEPWEYVGKLPRLVGRW